MSFPQNNYIKYQRSILKQFFSNNSRAVFFCYKKRVEGKIQKQKNLCEKIQNAQKGLGDCG